MPAKENVENHGEPWLGITVASESSLNDKLVARKMEKATLGGLHSHRSVSGISIHVFRRDGKLMARGRFQGRQFGLTLGSSETDSLPTLRKLLVELDEGRFVPPSNRPRQIFPTQVPRLSTIEVLNRYLDDRRKVNGKQTSNDYSSRLAWVIEFCEQAEFKKRYPYFADIDRHFCVDLKAFLHAQQTTRNGCAGAKPKPISARHIYNIMYAFQSLLRWAMKPEIRLVPADWIFPLSDELVGSKPRKSPLREIKLPVAERLQLLPNMDSWQLCTLGMMLVLPLRAEEVQGLLVEDVSFSERWLMFGTRFGGSDFTKGKTDFVVPYPAEIEPMFRWCIAGRSWGPLIRSRSVTSQPSKTNIQDNVEDLLSKRLQEKSAKEIATAQDRKEVFRHLLVELGGVSYDEMSREMNQLLAQAGLRKGRSLKTLREAVSNEMKQSGMPHLDLRYLTGHATSDIMNDYASVDPAGSMKLYFESVQPLLNALHKRVLELGIADA